MATSTSDAESVSEADSPDTALRAMGPTVEAALVENRREFRRFLVRRVGDVDTAEDVLHQFYLRAIEKGSGLRKSESVVAWLYRVLRTTLTDHYRRETTRRQREADYAQIEILSEQGRGPELERVICACFEKLLPALKPDYADLLRRVDLQGMPPREIARDLGIAPNNLRVRLHRARQAMKHSLLLSCRTCAEHGCLDCDCSQAERWVRRADEAVPSVP